MSSPSLIQRLEALFELQLEAATALEKLLRDENEALIRREHKQIHEITGLKEAKTAELESLAKMQGELFRSIKLPFSAEVLDQVINESAGKSANKIRQVRDNLETVLQACQAQNIINGRIIAANRQSAEAALAILRGQFSSNSLTYGAAGQPVKEQSRSQISKA